MKSEIIIEEPWSSRVIRIFTMMLYVFLIIFGAATAIVMAVYGFIGVICGLGISFVGYYLYRKLARVAAISDEAITIDCHNKQFRIRNRDIVSVFRFYRWTPSKKFWMQITVNWDGSFKKRNFMILNEPEYGFVARFKETGVKLINFID